VSDNTTKETSIIMYVNE